MVKADLLIRDAVILTQDDNDTVIHPGTVVVSGGKIIAVGKSEELAQQYCGKELIEAKGKALLPGFVNTHFHFTQNFMKGTQDDLDLLDWIDKVSFPRIKVTIDEYRRGVSEIHKLASLHAGIDLLSSGVTCTTNMEWGMRPEIAEAYKKTGMRITTILTLTDVDSWTPPEAIIPEDEIFGLARDLISEFSRDSKLDFAYGIACRKGHSHPIPGRSGFLGERCVGCPQHLAG